MGSVFIYAWGVTANSVTELDNSNIYTRRTNAPFPLLVGVFLCPSFNGGRARDTERCAGVLVYRFVNSRTATALILDKINGSSNLPQGAISMSNNDKSRLCDENRALIRLLNRHLTAHELYDVNARLYQLFSYFICKRENVALYQAVHAVKQRYNKAVYDDNSKK